MLSDPIQLTQFIRDNIPDISNNISNISNIYISNISNNIYNISNNFIKSFLPNKKLNLVLDLDETLIKCILPYSDEHLNRMKSCAFYLCDFKINDASYCIFFRPYLFDCLSKWNEDFNIYIYTCSLKEYCDVILNHIKLFVPSLEIYGVWSRKSINEKISLKHLHNLEINYKNTIIIDDNIKVWSNFTENVINIKTFLGPIDLSYNYILDDELLKVNKYLDDILKNKPSSFFSYYDISKLVAEYNKKYRQENWIYNGYNFTPIWHVLLNGEYKLLTQPFLKLTKI